MDRDTTKLRIVFDGSAKTYSDHLLLNDHLMNGPNYVPHLIDVLLRFRCHQYALTADIKKAFLQIDIREKDQDKLRFLWLRDVESNNPSIVQYRFCRLAFGLCPSPSILGATSKKHLEKYTAPFPKPVEVLGHLFVDDLSCSTKSFDSAMDIASISKAILAEGAFNLRKFNSNSPDLRKRLGAELESESTSKCEREVKNDIIHRIILLQEEESSYGNTVVGNLAHHNTKKILGVTWNNDSDDLCFHFQDIIAYGKMLLVTKHLLLRVCSKVFDPLGVLSPFIVRMKVAFQELCLEGVNWDEELQGADRLQFYSFLSEVEWLSTVRIPRCYFSKVGVFSVELHGFSDSSQKAYGCVIYLRVQHEDGTVVVHFVSSKTKVTPLSRQTIPRLELLGATLLAHHVSHVKQVLSEEYAEYLIKTMLWVDSYTVLC